MKTCPNCSYENVEGYMFCEDCGEDITLVESEYSEEGYTVPTPQEPAIILRVQSTSRPIIIALNKQTTLGRYDGDRRYQPDVDLAMYNALEKGVSAMHATIEHSSDGVMLRDVGSTNGTYLNGRRMVAQQNYILRDGDEIRLGRLVTHIKFQGGI